MGGWLRAATTLHPQGKAGATRPRRPSTRAPRIVLLEPDPYLASVIERQLPDAEVIESFEPTDAATLPADLAVVRVEHIDELEAAAAATFPTIIVTDSALADQAERLVGSERVLVRPFVPGEVHSALRRALSIREPRPSRGVHLDRIRAWAAAARVAGVALAGILDLGSDGIPHSRAWVLAIAFIYSSLRLLVKKPWIVASVADVSVAALFVATTGGVSSNYAPLAVIVVFAAGLDLGYVGGSLCGALIGIAAFPDVIDRISAQSMRPTEAVVWFSLMCGAGIAAGLLKNIADREAEPDRQALAEMNTTLTSLYRKSRAMPGGLDVGVVGASVVSEIREGLGSPAVALVISFGVGPIVVEAFGLDDREALERSDVSEILAALPDDVSLLQGDAIAAPISAAFSGQERVYAAPLLRAGRRLGVILCVASEADGRTRSFLRTLAEDAALSIENAQLFARIRDLSADDERRRLARDLHDGVVQAIAHLRLELELLKNTDLDREALQRDMGRLARVAGRAESDIRASIAGLRGGSTTEGLAGALRAYLRDMAAFGGPTVSFEARGVTAAHPLVEAEMFRIAQEALSNALRHARASCVRVTLADQEDGLKLVIEDDGIGFDLRHARRGVGIDAMGERAAQIGGKLSITRAETGGTRVELMCPVAGPALDIRRAR